MKSILGMMAFKIEALVEPAVPIMTGPIMTGPIMTGPIMAVQHNDHIYRLIKHVFLDVAFSTANPAFFPRLEL